MKIFIALSSLKASYGGPAYSVARLANGLADAGLEVGLWAADGSAADASSVDPNARVSRLTGSARQALLRFGAPHVVHDNGLWMPHNHWLATMSAKESIRRVVSIRGMLEPWAIAHKRWKKRIAWWLYQRHDVKSADVHHVTGELEARNVGEFHLGVPIRVIPNGVDLPRHIHRADRQPQDIRTALFLGRLYPVKGLPMLIKAWKLVEPKGWRLCIVGPDEAGHKAELLKIVESTGLKDVISFPGAVSGEAKRAAFLNADLFILSSHSESFGMAAAEALAHEVPVIATKTTPWPMLEDKGCGWLTEPTVERLAEALHRATSADPQALKNMGRRGRAYIEATFGWDRIVADFVLLYEQLLRLH